MMTPLFTSMKIDLVRMVFKRHIQLKRTFIIPLAVLLSLSLFGCDSESSSMDDQMMTGGNQQAGGQQGGQQGGKEGGNQNEGGSNEDMGMDAEVDPPVDMEVDQNLPLTENLILGDEQGQLHVQTGIEFEMKWMRGDEVLLDFDAQSIRIGWVNEPNSTFNYDPFPVITQPNLPLPPLGLQWSTILYADLVEQDEASAVIDLQLEFGYRAWLELTWLESGRVKMDVISDRRIDPAVESPSQDGEALSYPYVAFFSIRPKVDSEEGLYGLGEVYDEVNQRGYVKAMQLEFDFELEERYNEVHAPIPYVVGSRGWGFFVPSDAPGAFDVASLDPSRVSAYFGGGRWGNGGAFIDLETWLDQAHQSERTEEGKTRVQGLSFYLFSETDPLDLTRHYYDVTGWPSLPAPWALGPWIWRDENEDQDQVISDLNILRQLDLPTSGYWIDRPYESEIGAFDFNPLTFPDPLRMKQTFDGLGFKWALWHAPYIDQEAPSLAEKFQYAQENGFIPTLFQLLLNEWGPPIDFTHPQAITWWQDQLQAYSDLGIIGYKLDYAEDVVVGLNGQRTPWGFYDGSDELTMHVQYQRLYHKTYADTLPEDGGFLMCRTARWGDQVNINVMWPADLDADFSTFRQRVQGDDGNEYGAIGGIPAALVAGLSLSASGFPFFASDTGGYRHAPPDKETFMRWLELSSLGTVMQSGTKASDVPWEFTDENGFDEEVVDTYRKYALLNIRLFPYKWTYAQNLKTTGRSIQRAFGLAYPEFNYHPSDQFMLGDFLFVSPIIQRDQRQKSVFFPAGQWMDWWTGTEYEGGQEHEIDAPLDHLPLFAKKGSLIPLLRPTLDTLAPVLREAGQEENENNPIEDLDDPIESFADDPGQLWLRGYGLNEEGQDWNWTLYDGTTLRFTHQSLSDQSGTVFTQGRIYEFKGWNSMPTSLLLNGQELTFVMNQEELLEFPSSAWYSAETQSLWIHHQELNAEIEWVF